MTVEVQLPDGRTVEFPDGVTPDVVERTTKSLISGGDKPTGTTMNTVGGVPLVDEEGRQFSTGHVNEAIAEGLRTAPKIISQEEIDRAMQGGFVSRLTGELMKGLNAPLEVGNALFRGGQQAVQEALSPWNTLAARDFAAMPEAFFGSKAREAPGLPLRPDLALRKRLEAGEPPPARFIGEHYNEPVPGAYGPPEAFGPPAPMLTRLNELLRDREPVEERSAEAPTPQPQPQPSSEGWRPVEPGEVFQPGRSYRMNQATGGNEVYEPTAGAPGPGYRQYVDPTKPFTYNPPSSGWPAGTSTWAERGPPPPEPQPARQQQPQPEAQPAGGAVGADVTREPIPPMTKTQAQDAFEKSVLQTAEDRAGPQMEDHTAYLPEAKRTEAAREFSEEASAHEKALGDADPQFKQAVRETQDEGNRIALDDYKRQAGDNHAIDEAVKARAAFSPDQLGVFEKETPTAMGQRIIDYFDRLLNSPEGKRKAVRSILEDARDGFLDQDGNPETMPSRLYGGRKNLTDILDEGTGGSTSTRKASVKAARNFLTDALNNHVDPAINDGAPLFDTFRTQWHELSKPIDRMEFLQQHLFGPGDVRDVAGKIQFQALQNLLEKMVKLRRMPGNNPAKSFDLEHLDALLAIRNELAAWHLRDRLGRVAGSDTHQRAQAAASMKAGPVGQAISGAADVVGHGLAIKTMGPLGPVAYQGVGRPVVQRVLKRSATKKLNVVKQRMLETAPRNPLMPPGG